MKNLINYFIGIILSGSYIMNLTEWFLSWNWNAIVVTLTSIGGLIFVYMGIYDRYIRTKQFKKEKGIK